MLSCLRRCLPQHDLITVTTPSPHTRQAFLRTWCGNLIRSRGPSVSIWLLLSSTEEEIESRAHDSLGLCDEVRCPFPGRLPPVGPERPISPRGPRNWQPGNDTFDRIATPPPVLPMIKPPVTLSAGAVLVGSAVEAAVRALETPP